MKDNNITINQIPARTYRWLSMNMASVKSFDGVLADASFDVPIQWSLKDRSYSAGLMATALGSEFDDIFTSSNLNEKYLSISKQTSSSQPIKLTCYAADSKYAMIPVYVDVEKNASGTMIIFLGGNDSSAGMAVQVRINLEEASDFRLVCVAGASVDNVFLDVGTRQQANSSFKLEQLFLKGSHIYTGCRSDLIGDGSSFDTKIAYEVSGDDRLDMNYIVNHFGKRTLSDMIVSGVLRDNAYKLFRGTIDFKRGAKDAIGNEQEDVLLLDDGVENKTIPLILCQEEDVEGNHGATIGRLSEELMFYMMSRGMNTEEIYEMMADARIDSVCRNIPDAGIIEEIAGLRKS